MERFEATIDGEGRVVIPVRVRWMLGLRPGGNLVFVIEDGRVSLAANPDSNWWIFRSVPGIPGTTTEDFERMIAEAIEDAVNEDERRLR